MYMNIITRERGFVNPCSCIDIDLHEQVFSLSKWEEKKIESLKMARKMMRAGYLKRGLRMEQCSQVMSFSKCEDCDNSQIHHASLCRDKLCPICKWRLATKRYLAMSEILRIASSEYPEAIYQFVTLTVPNCDVDCLSATLKTMSTQWNKLLQRVNGKRSAGWARSLEITYNAKTKQLHPHYHCIFMYGTQTEADLYGQGVVADWVELNEGASFKAQSLQQIAKKDLDGDISSVALEVFKYSTKDEDLENMPLAVFREFVTQIGGKRMVSFGGWLKECKRLVDVDMETATDEEGCSCRFCGSKRLHDVLCEWSGIDTQYKRLVI